jgi:hypothetical protein
MSETYLSLKENAFRDPSPESNDFRVGMADLEKLFGMVDKVVK